MLEWVCLLTSASSRNLGPFGKPPHGGTRIKQVVQANIYLFAHLLLQDCLPYPFTKLRTACNTTKISFAQPTVTTLKTLGNQTCLHMEYSCQQTIISPGPQRKALSNRTALPAFWTPFGSRFQRMAATMGGGTLPSGQQQQNMPAATRANTKGWANQVGTRVSVVRDCS